MALDKNGIAKRIARELHDGYYVNLGIGIPTLVAGMSVEGPVVVAVAVPRWPWPPLRAVMSSPLMPR